MKKRIIKNLIAILVIIAMVSVTACSRDNADNNNTEENGSNTGDNTEQDNTTEDNIGNGATASGVTDQYNTLLQGNPSRDDVYGFIDENITSANEDDADQLVYGVLGYEDTYEDVDYNRLYAYKNYVSDEVEDYLELMYENQQKPYMDNSQINVTLDELLDRAEDFEKHITEFPDGITTQPSYEMYCNIMNAAITGGYDKENNVASFYKGDADNRIDGRAIDEYMKFLADEVNDGNEDQANTNNTNGRSSNANNANNNNSNNTNDNANNNTNSDSAANIEANTSNGANNTGANSRTSTNNASNNNVNSNNTNSNNASGNNTTGNNNTSNTNNVTGSTANIGDNSETNFTAPVTRSIVQDYVDLLVKTKNEITAEVEVFYTNLNTLISEKFDL